MDIILCIPSPILMIGALVGMTALGRRARAFAQKSQAALLLMILVYGLISFGISFAFSSRVAADAYLPLFGGLVNPRKDAPTPVITEETLNRAEAVTNELWRRAMVPPDLRQPCYADEQAVCDLADDLTPEVQGGDWGWDSYLRLVGKGLLSTVLTVVLVWMGARREAYEAEIDASDKAIVKGDWRNRSG
jgi:hypothetical protein